MSEERTEIIEIEKKHELMNAFSDSESFNKLFVMGKTLSQSTLVPQSYQGKPTDCMIAIDMANRMNVSPMMVMQNLYVVKGKPTWSGQACMSMIRGSKEFVNVRPIYVGEKQTDSWGCYIEARYRDTGEVVNGTVVTIKMAKDEEWYQKNGSKWKTMPEQMLAYRAASFFARVYIPNALMGVYVEGEAEDIRPASREKPANPFENEIMREAEEVFQ